MSQGSVLCSTLYLYTFLKLVALGETTPLLRASFENLQRKPGSHKDNQKLLKFREKESETLYTLKCCGEYCMTGLVSLLAFFSNDLLDINVNKNNH